MSGKGATSDSSPNDDGDNQSGEDSDGFMRPGAHSNLHHRENIEFDMEAEYDEETLAQLPFIVRLVVSPKFDGFMGLMVAINALMMGVEYQMSDSDLRTYYLHFKILDLFFLFIFTVELSLRLYVWGVRTLTKSPALMLDALIVVVGITTELILPLYYGTFWATSAEEEE